MRRYLREEGGWNPHLERSKQFIIDHLNDIQPQSVCILGSGWLLDVPMEELLSACSQLVLVDIAHPAQIRHRYKDNPKVKFETADMSGIAEYLLNTPQKQLNYFEVIKHITHHETAMFRGDMVVSLNLLSQINDYPVSYLTPKLGLNQAQRAEISQLMQQRHIDALPRGCSLLISDYEEEYRDEDSVLIGAAPTVFVHTPTSEQVREWDWAFDTHFTYREDCHTTLKVRAIRF